MQASPVPKEFSMPNDERGAEEEAGKADNR
jgi:hypothetical protein